MFGGACCGKHPATMPGKHRAIMPGKHRAITPGKHRAINDKAQPTTTPSRRLPQLPLGMRTTPAGRFRKDMLRKLQAACLQALVFKPLAP
jgi:hypothetical protein